MSAALIVSREPGRPADATMDKRFVTLEDVEVVEATDSALLCRVAGRGVWVPLAHVGIADRAVRKPGDRGVLIIPSWLARDLGLDPGP